MMWFLIYNHENNTEQIELTLVIKQSDDILVIQAREK